MLTDPMTICVNHRDQVGASNRSHSLRPAYRESTVTRRSILRRRRIAIGKKRLKEMLDDEA
jgi:hypothetical protein